MQILIEHREFSLNGDYRNILTKPQDLKYEIIDYTDRSKELTKTDWDLIKPPTAESNEINENSKGILICLFSKISKTFFLYLNYYSVKKIASDTKQLLSNTVSNLQLMPRWHSENYSMIVE